MDVRVYLTGELRLEVGEVIGEQRHLAGRQTRLAAAFLLAERNRSIDRAELAELLWPADLPRSWETALRGVVAKVRAYLASAGLSGAAVLRTEHGAYRVTLPEETVVDLEAAVLALESAERLLSEHDADGAVAAALAARAVTARPFLPGEHGPWVEARQADLRAWHLRALLALARGRLTRGETELAARDAEEAIGVEPLLETAHQLLVQALAAAGNRGAALRAYERCRRMLIDELGVGPSSQTEWLYLALLRDEPTPRRPTATPGETRMSTPVAGAGLFVGRTAELTRISRAWDRARAGHGRAVLVGGEAGIGKTRLVTEAARAAARDGATVLHGRCGEGGAAPYQPFTEAIARHIAACTDEELRRHVGVCGSELARLISGLAQRLGGLVAPPPAPDAGTDRHRLFQAVTSFLSSVADDGPLVLVLDDLQWAGAPGLMLFSHVVRAIESSTVLVLGTYRDDEAAQADLALADALAALRREPEVERLLLDGLAEADVATLVGQSGAGSDTDGALARRVHGETDGNPFYVGELLRHLAESGETTGDGIGVPEGVRELVGRRLARLPPIAQRALVVAAVAGRDFDIEVVERAGELISDDALDALEEAAAARFVVEAPGAVAGRYRFAHALVHSAVYDRASSTRRARLHRRVADAVEDLAGDDLGQVAAELVDHHLAAGPSGDGARIFELAVRAGDFSLAQLAYEDAALRYEQAVAHLPPDTDGARRATVLLALGDAHQSAEAEDHARQAYREVAAIARRLGDAETLARAALGGFGRGTHGVSTWTGRDERVDLLEEALAALGPHDSEMRVRVMSALSVAYLLSETDRPRRDALASDAVASARRLGRPSVLVGALAAGRVALWGPEHADARLAHTDEVVAAAAASGDIDQELRARLARVNDHFELGDRPAAVAELESARTVASRLDQPYWSWRIAAWDALVSLIDGRFTEAESRAAEALVIRADDSDAHALQCYGIQLTCLRLAQRRSSEVIEMLRTAAHHYPMLPTYRAALALCYAETGQLVEASNEFDHFADGGFSSPPPDSNWSTGVACLAEVCAHLGDADNAKVLHRKLAPSAGKMIVLDAFGGGGDYWGSVLRLLGLLEMTMGRLSDAEQSLESALESETRFGAAPWVARTQHALASLLRRSDSPASAERAADLHAAATATETRLGIVAPHATSPVV